MEKVSFKMNIKFHHPVKAVGLVLGGWYPLVFLDGHLLLIDRNILSTLRQLDSSRRKDAEANRWWFQFLNKPYQRINPALCALESPFQRTPTFDEFREQYDSAYTDLKKLLPDAYVVDYTDPVYNAAYEMLRQFNERYQAEVQFLVEVAPWLSDRKSDVVIQKVEEKILDRARALRLLNGSMIVIAALSCLYESKDGATPSVGRAILKPVRTFGLKEAHNAISDLRALELLVGGSALERGKVALCTLDRGLAAFWCALQVKNPVWENNALNYSFTLDEQIFPRLSRSELERIQLQIQTSNES
jgi:hypothetical protein